jgi:hypothetical protein
VLNFPTEIRQPTGACSKTPVFTFFARLSLRIEATTGSKPYEGVSLMLPEAFDNAVNLVSERDRVWLLLRTGRCGKNRTTRSGSFLPRLKTMGPLR